MTLHIEDFFEIVGDKENIALIPKKTIESFDWIMNEGLLVFGKINGKNTTLMTNLIRQNQDTGRVELHPPVTECVGQNPEHFNRMADLKEKLHKEKLSKSYRD